MGHFQQEPSSSGKSKKKKKKAKAEAEKKQQQQQQAQQQTKQQQQKQQQQASSTPVEEGVPDNWEDEEVLEAKAAGEGGQTQAQSMAGKPGQAQLPPQPEASVMRAEERPKKKKAKFNRDRKKGTQTKAASVLEDLKDTFSGSDKPVETSKTETDNAQTELSVQITEAPDAKEPEVPTTLEEGALGESKEDMSQKGEEQSARNDDVVGESVKEKAEGMEVDEEPTTMPVEKSGIEELDSIMDIINDDSKVEEVKQEEEEHSVEEEEEAMLVSGDDLADDREGYAEDEEATKDDRDSNDVSSAPGTNVAVIVSLEDNGITSIENHINDQESLSLAAADESETKPEQEPEVAVQELETETHESEPEIQQPEPDVQEPTPKTQEPELEAHQLEPEIQEPESEVQQGPEPAESEEPEPQPQAQTEQEPEPEPEPEPEVANSSKEADQDHSSAASSSKEGTPAPAEPDPASMVAVAKPKKRKLKVKKMGSGKDSNAINYTLVNDLFSESSGVNKVEKKEGEKKKQTTVKASKKQAVKGGDDDEEVEESWDAMFDDNGDCLDPKIVDEVSGIAFANIKIWGLIWVSIWNYWYNIFILRYENWSHTNISHL